MDNLCNNGPSIKKLKNDLMKTKKKTFLDNPLLFLLQNRCYLIYTSRDMKKKFRLKWILAIAPSCICSFNMESNHVQMRNESLGRIIILISK